MKPLGVQVLVPRRRRPRGLISRLVVCLGTDVLSPRFVLQMLRSDRGAVRRADACGIATMREVHDVGIVLGWSEHRMKRLLFAGAMTLIASHAFTQTPGSPSSPPAQLQGAAAVDASLATPTGHEVNVSVGSYTYTEPGTLSISIHGFKIGGEYTGTLPLNQRQHWFAQADVRATGGNVTYDGWCSPFLITPNSSSPNGYELNEGDASPCSESGDHDWYLETRGMVGKDFIGRSWGFSPATGLGVRHLSNGTSGLAGYRTDNYLYLPVGLTARTTVGSQRALSFNVEYDHLLHGWQKTRDAALGGGDVPATATAPAFTIDSFTDVSFAQHGGWALRASAKYQVTSHWSVEPAFIHWNVSDSPVNYETVTFTVNRITAQEQLGYYEPFNVTNEFGLKLGFHF
jgi:hypothetical protein